MQIRYSGEHRNIKRNIKRRLIMLLAVLMLFVSLPVLHAEATDNGASGGGNDRTVLAFTSDIHNTSDNIAAMRLDRWLDKIEDKYGRIDVMSFCGDMGSARANSEQFWMYTKSVMDVVDGEAVPGVYTTGNHEYFNGGFDKDNPNPVSGKYKLGEDGTPEDQAGGNSNYRIYCLGTDNWNDHQDNYTPKQIAELTEYLNSVGNDKPVIILTHFPLHCYKSGRMTRQTEGAYDVIEALNNAAVTNNQKIVLLWGHNHTVSDTYYDSIYKPGESIEYAEAEGSSAELKFYYAAAGCMSDSEYGTGSAFVKGKGLVITVNSDRMLTFAYYDAYGNNVTEGGTYSEYENPAEGLVIDESRERDEEGKYVTGGQTVPEGRKLQLHASTEPADAVCSGLIWTSADEAVATVSETGLVRGISEGKTVITAAIQAEEERDKITAEIEITVAPRVKDSVYVLTDRLEPGKEYAIASKSSGSAFVLMNDGGSPKTEAVTIESERFSSNGEGIAFTAEGTAEGEEVSISGIRSGELYLSASRRGLNLSLASQEGWPWTYDSEKGLTCSSTRGEHTIAYHIYYDAENSSFSVTTDDSDLHPVYLFEKTEPEPERVTASITYRLEGGSYKGSTADITEAHFVGDVITIHEAPEKDGYSFSYWKGSEYRPGDTYTVSGDHIFTAVWTEKGKGSGAAKTGDKGAGFYLVMLIGAAVAMTAMLAGRLSAAAKRKTGGK